MNIPRIVMATFLTISATGSLAIGYQPEAFQPNAENPARDLVGDPLPKGILWRLGTDKLRHWWIKELKFTSDGKMLMSSSFETDNYFVWDVETGQRVASHPAGAFPKVIAASRDLYLATDEQTIKVHRWSDRSLVQTLAGSKVKSARFSKDYKYVVAINEDDWVYRWDIASGMELSRWRAKIGESPNTHLITMFSPDATVLSARLAEDEIRDREGRKLQFWDVATGKEARAAFEVDLHADHWNWSEDGKQLRVYVHAEGNKPPRMDVFDFATGKKLDVAGDTGIGATRDAEGPLKESLYRLQGRSPMPDGRGVLVNNGMGLELYDLQTMKLQWKRRIAPAATGAGMKMSFMSRMAFSPDEDTVACGTHCGYIELLNWKTGESVGFSKRHPGHFAGDIRFLANDSFVLLQGSDELDPNSATMVEVRTGKRQLNWPDGWFLALSPDQRHIARISTVEPKLQFVEVIELPSSRVVWRDRSSPIEARFSADGKRLALSNYDDQQGKRVVDSLTGQTLFKLPEKAFPETLSDDFKRFVYLDKTEIEVFDTRGAAALWTWRVPEEWYAPTANFIQGTRHIVIFGSRGGSDASLFVLDGETGRTKIELHSKESLELVSTSRDGKYLAYQDGSMYGGATVKIIEVESNRMITEVPRRARMDREHFAFAPNGNTFAYNIDDVTVVLCETATGREINRFAREFPFVRHIEIAPDNRRVGISYNDSTIWCWDPYHE